MAILSVAGNAENGLSTKPPTPPPGLRCLGPMEPIAAVESANETGHPEKVVNTFGGGKVGLTRPSA
jgi:hypothetical protein